MALPNPRPTTAAEYLRYEREAPEKHEFLDGAIFAMAGASPDHNRIVLNLAAVLRSAFRGGPCEAFVVDQRIKVFAPEFYAYPDGVIVCGSPEFEDERGDTLLNPTVLIEVLSPSTEAYDRGTKFAQYRRLSTLRELLFIAQDRPVVDHYLRRGDQWLLTAHEGLEASVSLEAAPATLPMAELYERVDFAKRSGGASERE
jgi:Uma2 family endonuclease